MPTHTFPPPPLPTSSNPKTPRILTNGHNHSPSSSPELDLANIPASQRWSPNSPNSPRHPSSETGRSMAGSGLTRYGEGEQVEEGGEEGEYDSGAEDNVTNGHRGRMDVEGGGGERVVVHVEARQRTDSFTSQAHLTALIHSFLRGLSQISIGAELADWREVGILEREMERIWVADSEPPRKHVNIDNAEISLNLYQATTNVELEDFAFTDEDDEEDAQKISAASVKELPATDLDGLWDNLVYADNIKARLLNYIYSTIAFSEASVDYHVISWNRMVLLHGPPGTGKTSLCRGLAQKLSIRLKDLYAQTKLVEINSHSLFSKWFSESGKLVQNLFSSVQAMVDDQNTFVVVMIDEVESLTAARAGAMSGNEPSDAVRVVNALLTQLDKLKTRRNVLVMTTSNMSGAIDPAFIDRADIKEYVSYPPPQAIYWILTSCIHELIGRNLICKTKDLLDWDNALIARQRIQDKLPGLDRNMRACSRITEIAEACSANEMAGRFLRRLPVLAHARYISPVSTGERRPRSIERWLDAMERVVEDERKSREILDAGPGKRAGT